MNEFWLINTLVYAGKFGYKNKFRLPKAKRWPSLKQLQIAFGQLGLETVKGSEMRGNVLYIKTKSAGTIIFGGGKKIHELELSYASVKELLVCDCVIRGHVSFQSLDLYFPDKSKPVVVFKGKPISTLPHELYGRASEIKQIRSLLYYKTKSHHMVQCDLKMILNLATSGETKFTSQCRLLTPVVSLFEYSPYIRDLILYAKRSQNFGRMKSSKHMFKTKEQEVVKHIISIRCLLVIACYEEVEKHMYRIYYRFLKQPSLQYVDQLEKDGCQYWQSIPDMYTVFDRNYGSFLVTLSYMSRLDIIIINKNRRSFIVKDDRIRCSPLSLTHQLHRHHVDLFIGTQNRIYKSRLALTNFLD